MSLHLNHVEIDKCKVKQILSRYKNRWLLQRTIEKTRRLELLENLVQLLATALANSF